MQQPANQRRMQQLLGEGLRAWRLMRDPTTPGALKLIPALGLLYVLFPVDLVPDLIPGAGQLDDVAILLVALRLFLQLAGPDRQAGGIPGERASGPGTSWVEGGQDRAAGGASVGGTAEPNVVTTTYRVRKD